MDFVDGLELAFLETAKDAIFAEEGVDFELASERYAFIGGKLPWKRVLVSGQARPVRPGERGSIRS